jgi:hypothetical protein
MRGTNNKPIGGRSSETWPHPIDMNITEIRNYDFNETFDNDNYYISLMSLPEVRKSRLTFNDLHRILKANSGKVAYLK